MIKVELYGCIFKEKNKEFSKFDKANVVGHDADFCRKNDMVDNKIYMDEKGE